MQSHSISMYKSPEGFASFIENSPVGVILVAQNGSMVLVNPQAERLFGYTEQELVGKPVEILMSESVAEKHKKYKTEYLKHPSSRPMGLGMNLYARKKSGEEFPVEISLSSYVLGGERMAMAFIADISIRESKNETYRNLFENSVAGIIVWDMVAETPVDVNAKGLAMFGYASKNEFLENYVPKNHFVSAKDCEYLINTFKKNGLAEAIEAEMRKKDGTRFWALLFCKLNSDRKILQSIMIDITERKNAEQRVGLFIDHAPAAVAMLDRQMRYIVVSKRWTEDYKLNGQNIIGRSCYEFFPGMPERWKEFLQRALEGESFSYQESSFVWGDGKVEWLRWELYPWYEASGEVGGVMLFTEVITKRKEAEEKFKNIFENLVVPMILIDLTTTQVLDVNEVFAKMLGYQSRKDYQNNHVKGAHHTNQGEWQKLILEVKEKGESVNDIRLKKLDGSLLWIKLYLKLAVNQNLIQAVMFDITERKIAEEKYRDLFENSLMAALIIDTENGRLINVNQKAFRLFGYPSKQEFIQKFSENPIFHFVNHEDWRRVVKMTNSNGELSGDFRMKKLDGEMFWAELFVKENKEQKIFQIILVDVTESRHFHEELEAKVKDRTLELATLLGREKELNDMKSRFVSMASHEFRTPLSTILSSLYLIESYQEESQRQKRNLHIDRIKSSVKNLTDLLNDFLSLDKLEQGKIDFTAEKFDLPATLKEIQEEMNSVVKPGQSIHCSHTGVSEIIQDKKLLRNVLINLLSNAVKYSGENKRIFLTSTVNRNLAIIKVKDEGMGIPEQEQKEIFRKFFRARNAVNIQGTGLGLNIVKNYLELMGGSISFHSELGKGTSFRVELPCGFDL